jgi:hypothetical protein
MNVIAAEHNCTKEVLSQIHHNGGFETAISELGHEEM